MSRKRFIFLMFVLGGFILPATNIVFALHLDHDHQQKRQDPHHRHNSKNCAICHHVFTSKLSAVILPAADLTFANDIDYCVVIPESFHLKSAEYRFPHLRGPPDRA